MTFTRTRTDDCLSDLQMDVLTCGALDASAAQSARGHLAGCTRCTQRARDLAEDAEAFRLAPPRISLEPAPRRSVVDRLMSGWGVGGLAAALAAMLLFFIVQESAPSGQDGVRRKGNDSLAFFVKRGDQVVPGLNGTSLRPGDRVRFTVSTNEPRHVVVLGLDSAGVVTTFHDSGREVLPPGSDIALPDSFILDGTLGAEHVAAFFCSGPVSAAEAQRALVAEPAAPMLQGCSVDLVTWEKTKE